jgi:hypothetical protein
LYFEILLLLDEKQDLYLNNKVENFIDFPAGKAMKILLCKLAKQDFWFRHVLLFRSSERRSEAMFIAFIIKKRVYLLL